MGQNKQRLLLCVLDWGLGHASRCVPLVHAFQKLGWDVWLASSGDAAELLALECPDCRLLRLPAYGICYPTSSMHWNMAIQLPRIIRTAIREYRLLRTWTRTHRINLILSDARFGCFHSALPSFLLTHQLRPLFRLGWLEPVAQWMYGRWLRCFRQVWVPDYADARSLSGLLSEGRTLLPPIAHLGPLSRFPANGRECVAEQFDLLVLLSGPEPQRTLFEQRLFPQLARSPLRVALVRGKRGSDTRLPDLPHVTRFDLLHGADLYRLIAASRYLCCRSGYSSLMDLAACGKQAILVPTPGQTEQEYLAERTAAAGWAVASAQSAFDLATCWDQLAHLHSYPPESVTSPDLRVCLADLLREIP